MTVLLDRARRTGQPAPEPTSTAAAPAAGVRSAAEEHLRDLLARLAELSSDSPLRPLVREQVIKACLPMAEYLARRYRNRGEPLDDLAQVATLGLIKAVDGYDASRGAAFSSYAVPTIVGELKRHFRDKGWSVRVPRRLQELRLEITKVTGELTQQLGRAPTVVDLSRKLGVSEEDVISGLESGQAYSTLSLYTPVSSDESAAELADLLGSTDPALECVEQREALRPLIARLPRREQRILAMRFFGNMTQSQIAAETGISQMHVSRLLSHALRVLREGLLA